MKRNKLLLTALAVILTLGLMVAPAMAYFTSHTEAAGGVQLELGYKTTLHEDVDGFTKTISVGNEGPESCYVRVQAFASDGMKLDVSGDWTKSGDWYYYNGIVEAGGTTSDLAVSISNVPESAVDGQIIDVAIVYEAAKVIFNEGGSYKPGTDATNWELKPATTEGE